MRKLAYRLRRAAVWLLVCSYVLCMHTGSASACLCVDAQEHERNEDALVRILEEYQTMGAAIVWIKQGEIVDSFYYGRANRADDTPVTKDTLFRIASVSKMVSAVGLLRLMDMGIFDLDEDIGTYLDYQVRNPWFKDTPITIRQIMTHTASFKDDGHYKKALNGNVTKLPYVLAGNYANTNFTRQEPGTVSDYSNFGGGLLGAFMELFTGMTLDEWMVE
ncbi:MAG: serine hydrolase domain-containing protein, partial [Clostridia bacterium]